MLPTIKRWQVASKISDAADKNLESFPPIFRQILFNRGYVTLEAALQFLGARPPHATDPFLMKGLSAAVERLYYAIQHNEPVAIYGDYDADGVTATVLLVQTLKSLDADVHGYIPNRFDEGYGLNIEALNNLHEQGIKVVVTVDCGIRSLPEAEYARKLGLDLIITDHHHPGSQLPWAFSIINPKQPGDDYPDKDLAGVGIAYKLADGLVNFLMSQGIVTIPTNLSEKVLDLVALGTVADMAPLVGENRTLVRDGINQIRRPHRQGLLALIGVSGLKLDQINASQIGYTLGPRLNAAGRLESALASYQLLLTSDVKEAGELAQKLDNQNRDRQQITREIQEVAEQIALAEDPQSILLFASHPDFNSGVVGLAATRLLELYYRPTIIAQQGPTFTRGSCRSIPEFHITQALDQCADLLVHHGGHAAAAGFTIETKKLPELKQRLKAITTEQLSGLDLHPSIYVDAEIPLYELNPDILEYFDLLQPTGYGNPEANFISRRLKVNRYKKVGRDGTHLKLTVTDKKITYDAIAFSQGHWADHMPAYVDLLYHLELNEYNGHVTPQLRVRDLKPNESLV